MTEWVQLKTYMNTLDKHKKYRERYGESETFWGLGIEEETYFQFTKPVFVASSILRTAHTRERYSLNYYDNYKPGAIAAMDTLFTLDPFYPIPLLFNSHSFTKMDTKDNHATTYETVPKPNPAFDKALFEELCLFSPKIFKDKYEQSFVFDGDTVEFITQDFYKAKASRIIQELLREKKIFLDEVNRFMKEKKLHREKGALIYPPKNHPFAIYHTNPKNVAVFNNGTYHINITLPTDLGPTVGEMPTLVNPALFKKKHKNCIRVYQWMEPILIAVFGSPDIIGSKGSQRAAISRYIGIGTYDTHAMPEGKILTALTKSIRGSDKPFWWYKVYHERSPYLPLKELGMDINYKKHYLHGIELRMLDWFPEERLLELIQLLVYLAEVSLENEYIVEPANDPVWNGLVVHVLEEGAAYTMTVAEVHELEILLDLHIPMEKTDVRSIYKFILKSLSSKYKNGYLAKCFLKSAICY